MEDSVCWAERRDALLEHAVLPLFCLLFTLIRLVPSIRDKCAVPCRRIVVSLRPFGAYFHVSSRSRARSTKVSRVILKYYSKTQHRQQTQLKEGAQIPPPDQLMRQLVELANSENPPCANCDKRDKSTMFFCTTCGTFLKSREQIRFTR